MNRNDIARKVAQNGDIIISQATARYIIDEIEDIIKEELLNGGTVTFSGFFVMDSKLHKPKGYKHPITGKMQSSDTKYVPKCRFSDNFKKAISESVVGI